MLFYFPLNILAAWFFAHLKHHHNLMIAAALQIVGCWIRVFSFYGEENFWILMLGSFIFSMANPLILNSMSVISNMWFGDADRSRAVAIAGLMAPLGSLIGLALSGILAAGVDAEDPQDCMDRLHSMVYV